MAVPPAWWATRGVIDGGAAPNDYAAANLGQVKNIAKKAYDELESTAPGGAGTPLDNLIASWLAAPGQGITRNDYASVNQGQLKTLAKLYYDRLAELGYTGQPIPLGQTYPWSDITTDDNSYAAVNIGQVKYLFSFDTALIDPDTDGDGLTDSEEATHGTDPDNPDTDGDGLSDYDEVITHGTNPLNPDSDGDTLLDGEEITQETDPHTSNLVAGSWAEMAAPASAADFSIIDMNTVTYDVTLPEMEISGN